MHLQGKNILVTGGTGSFGRAFVNAAIRRGAKKVIVYSRSEAAQVEHERSMSSEIRERARFFLGDVRDRDRLKRAFEYVDYVVHAAALKHVDRCEYDPLEAVKTNINGSQNVIDAALDCGVEKVLAISTDKAVNPCNLYGSTKLSADKLFVAANAYATHSRTRFSVVRFGNFLNSSGSVFPLFRQQLAEERPLTVTHPEMTRFVIELADAVSFAIELLKICQGGEVVFPKMKAIRIWDVAMEMSPHDRPPMIVGMRDGEKLHEDFLTEADIPKTYEYPTYFMIFPNGRVLPGGFKVADGFRYSSDRCVEVKQYEQNILV